MARILFLRETISRNQFRWKYLENKKLFLNFLLHFWNQVSILNIFKKKDDSHTWGISEFRNSEKHGYINV